MQLGYANANADGYSEVMGFDVANPFAEFPVTLGGASNTYYADYYYRLTGQRIALLGGSWYSGSYAGCSFWNLNLASSNAFINFSGRLLKAGA